MRRRAVSALSWTGKSTGGTPVGLMGETPMPRRKSLHTRSQRPRTSPNVSAGQAIWSAAPARRGRFGFRRLVRVRSKAASQPPHSIQLRPAPPVPLMRTPWPKRSATRPTSKVFTLAPVLAIICGLLWTLRLTYRLYLVFLLMLRPPHGETAERKPGTTAGYTVTAEASPAHSFLRPASAHSGQVPILESSWRALGLMYAGAAANQGHRSRNSERRNT